MEEDILEAVKRVSEKLDELKEFLEDVFLTPEEYLLVKETDKLVREKRLDELVNLDDV